MQKWHSNSASAGMAGRQSKEKGCISREKILDSIRLAHRIKPEGKQTSMKGWLFYPEQSGQKFRTLF
jgi:hypothetical protein